MTRDARPAPTSKSDRGSAEKALSRGITVASGQVTHEYSRIVQKHFDSFMTVELGTDVIYRKKQYLQGNSNKRISMTTESELSRERVKRVARDFLSDFASRRFAFFRARRASFFLFIA